MAPKTPAPNPKAIEGQFPDSPEGWQRYWTIELDAARKEGSEDWRGIKAWQEEAAKIVKRYRVNKKDSKHANDARLNIFPANVQTQRAILVGNTPKCEVTRENPDPDDDDGRVAAEMIRRVLNHGLEQETKGIPAILARCTEDRLLAGMCGARIEFGADFEQVAEVPAQTGPCPDCQGQGLARVQAPVDPLAMMPEAPPSEPCPSCQGSAQKEMAPAVPAHEKPTNETADARYVNWRDQLWSPARTWDECRWWAVSAEMSKKQLRDAFGPAAEGVPMNVGKGKGKGEDTRKETPWSRARVWEVWSKEHRRVFHVVEGHSKCLFHVDNPAGEDPLGLEDFWPFPQPMIANAVSDAFLPTPDFKYAEDLYNEADDLTGRIRGIVKAIKVAGGYDSTNTAMRRLLDEACELELIPVKDWTAFMTKGGMGGAFQLLPIAEMAQTVQALVQQRNLVIEQIFQITGLGDIIRGQQQQSETATTSAIKARFASVRLQDLQKEVARYATDLQRLRKEIIARHFSIETIIQRSNILKSEDGQDLQLVLRAAQLIKSDHLAFRVVIKPEQVALQDWAQLKAQRGEVLQALGAYFASMMPFLQMCGQAGPQGVKAGMTLVLRNAQWLVAGMPGASGVEAAFDAFVGQVEKMAEAAAQQPPAPPPPDPKLLAAQVKAQAEIGKAKAGIQQTQIDGQVHVVKAGMDLQVAQAEHAMSLQKIEAQQRSGAAAQVAALLGPPGAA